MTPEETLTVGEAHVWLVRPERVGELLLAAYDRLLSPDERRRRERLVVPSARLALLLGRALVRTRLARYTGVAPERFLFRLNPHGRPEVHEPALSPPLYFNLTHTRGLVACVVACLPEVGIDAEDTGRDLHDLAIAERYFPPQEALRLRTLPPAERRQRFFASWTLRESYLKARGAGLSLGLSLPSFELAQGGIRASFDPRLGDDPAGWQFLLLRPDPHLVVAVSLRRGSVPDLALLVRECVPLQEEADAPLPAGGEADS